MGQSSFGAVGIPYKYVLCINLPVFAIGIDMAGANIQHGAAWLPIYADGIDTLKRFLVIRPVSYALHAWLMQQFMGIGWFAEFVYVTFISVAMAFLYEQTTKAMNAAQEAVNALQSSFV